MGQLFSSDFESDESRFLKFRLLELTKYKDLKTDFVPAQSNILFDNKVIYGSKIQSIYIESYASYHPLNTLLSNMLNAEGINSNCFIKITKDQYEYMTGEKYEEDEK